jgi:phosphate transport system protein
MLETRHEFHESIKQLEQQTLGGRDLVVERLDRALDSVIDQNVELAEIVIADDDRVDRRYLAVHSGCPVAARLDLGRPIDSRATIAART